MDKTGNGEQVRTENSAQPSPLAWLKRVVDWALVPIAVGSIVNIVANLGLSFLLVEIHTGHYMWRNVLVILAVVGATITKALMEHRN